MRVKSGGTRTDDLTRGGVGPWWLFGLTGVVSLIAGVILITEPSHSLNALAVIFGIFLLFDGIVAIVSALVGDSNDRALQSVIGVLGVVVGILLIRHPEHAVNLVGLIIGLWLVAAGLVRLLLAFRSGRAHLLGISAAVLEIAAGIIIVSKSPYRLHDLGRDQRHLADPQCDWTDRGGLPDPRRGARGAGWGRSVTTPSPISDDAL